MLYRGIYVNFLTRRCRCSQRYIYLNRKHCACLLNCTIPFESNPDQNFQSNLFLQAIKKREQQEEPKTDDDETVEDVHDGELLQLIS